MRYILDTDWIIQLLAGNKDAAEKIQHLDPEEIGISLVTVAEIYESAFTYANPEAHIHVFDHQNGTTLIIKREPLPVLW